MESEASDRSSSPGLPPVTLSDCIEQILHVTLSTYLQQHPSSTPLFSNHYCSLLLQPEPPLPNNNNQSHDDTKGVPSYPLYKHLARAINRCMNSGTFVKPSEEYIIMPIDESRKAKEEEWSELIVEKGAELSTMLEGVEFELHVQEPFFSQLRAGLKTVEGRCAVGNYNRIAPGSLLLFNKCLLLKVEYVKHYSTFAEMLQRTLSIALPGVKTIEEGVQIYRGFYTEEKEKSNGVVAISVSRPASQPYISMTNLLSGLSCDGVGGLLGMMHTAGTVPDALPPPKSSLILSSMRPHRPNVEGCSLTDAARALAKHVNRSSEGWWGPFYGGDSDKNRFASEVVNRMVNNSCWMNVHLIQPHECVFEVRVHEGYGARWSKDGSRFIGFLEPYTEEGYSKGWKH